MNAPARHVRDRPPLPAVAVAAVTVAFFALPFAAVLWRLPWSEVWTTLSAAEVRTALRLSITCSLLAAAVSFVFGLPLAWLLATVEFPGRRLVRALCALSMVLPPVVGGIALLFALGRRGIVGGPLREVFGISIPFSTTAVVIAQTFVAMPFLVLTVEGALRQHDHRDAEAARTLGASRWFAFRRVTIPAIRPALVAGTVLAWARALGEFGATITFAGNSPGATRTLPMVAYLSLQSSPSQALVVGLVLITVSFAVLVALRDSWFGDAVGGIR